MNNRLRDIRKRALLNQYQIAKKCCISQAYYSGIERGDIIAKSKYQERIAKVLGVSVNSIFPVDTNGQK